MEQTRLNVPKDLKTDRIVVKLGANDRRALEKGMESVGETNVSSYVRRLIQSASRQK
jgi:hypothetical protein